MKNSLSIIVILAICCSFISAQNAANGEKLFKATCTACHSIGKGKVVGPDLAGVTSKRNEKWLISWIKSSSAMIKKNDPVAVKLFNENNKMPMPDNNLTDAQVKDILAYIKNSSPKKDVKTTTGAVSPTNATTVPPSTVTTDKKAGNKKTENWVDAEFKLKSKKSPGEIDPKKLNDAFWTGIAGLRIPVAAQNVAYPHLTKSSVDSLVLKSAYFNNSIAILAEWKDTSRNMEVEVDKFADGFAIEFPLNTSNIPSYMMGNPGGRVHIVHWKSVWQEDCEKGFQDVQMKYPNMWVDVYPGLESYNDRSKKIYAKDITAEHIVETKELDHMPGTYSKNPMSQIKRKEPVEEASAEGFGTIATQESQTARGWAEWKNGKWTVCLLVPVNTGEANKAVVNDRTKVAFAIWDGGNQNIGGRKHFVPWVDLILEK